MPTPSANSMCAGRFFRNPDFQFLAVGAFAPDASVNRKVPSSLSRQPEIVAEAVLSRSGAIAVFIDAAGGCGIGDSAVLATAVVVATSGGGVLRGDFCSTATGAGNSSWRVTSEVPGTSSRAVNSAAVKTTRIITATIALEVVIHAKCVGAAATAGIFATAGFFDCVRIDLALFARGAFLALFTRTDTSPRLCVGLLSAEQMRCPVVTGT